VAAGTYGTPPPTGITSTMIYEPKYFLINGAPYTASSVPLPAGNAGTSVLLRFLNAGLKQRAPVIQGLYFSLVAEDGNAYGFTKQQYSMLLSAGKTIDAIITPAAYGNYAIYDRRLALTNAAASGGGMLAYLNVAPTGPSKVGLYHEGTWYLDASGNGAWDGTPTDSLFAFGGGLANAQAVAGDWTGTGASKIGVFSDGTWYGDLNGSGTWDGQPPDGLATFGAGIPGALAVVGDWSGTGTAKIGVYNNGAWWVDYNGNSAWDGTPVDRTFSFDAGIAGAIPVAGDWNGTGAANLGVYKDGVWYLDLNGNGLWDGTPADGVYTFGGGVAGAVPVTGDWTGTGRTMIGIYADGSWYLDMNGNYAWDGMPTDTLLSFGGGLIGAMPVAGAW
jgi:hypothetical protein